MTLLVLVLAAAGAWTLLTLTPPGDVAPASGFETDRATAHLEFIARAPRPLGSEHHAAVRDYLVKAGLSEDILSVEGHGKSRPLVAGTSDAARAKNRRVELGIVNIQIRYGAQARGGA